MKRRSAAPFLEPRVAMAASRTLGWMALSALVFVPAFALVWITRGWRGWQSPWLASLALFGTFWTLRAYLGHAQPKIDRLFSRQRTHLEAAATRFGERIAVLHTVAELARAINE